MFIVQTASLIIACAVQNMLSTLTICEDWTKSQQLSAMESYVRPISMACRLSLLQHDDSICLTQDLVAARCHACTEPKLEQSVAAFYVAPSRTSMPQSTRSMDHQELMADRRMILPFLPNPYNPTNQP